MERWCNLLCSSISSQPLYNGLLMLSQVTYRAAWSPMCHGSVHNSTDACMLLASCVLRSPRALTTGIITQINQAIKQSASHDPFGVKNPCLSSLRQDISRKLSSDWNKGMGRKSPLAISLVESSPCPIGCLLAPTGSGSYSTSRKRLSQ